MRFLKNIAIAALVTTAFAGYVNATDGIDLKEAATSKTFRFIAADYRQYVAGTLPQADEPGKLRNALYAKLDEALGTKHALSGAKCDFDIEGAYAVGKNKKGVVLPTGFEMLALNPLAVKVSAGLSKPLSSFGAQADIFSKLADIQAFVDGGEQSRPIAARLNALLVELDVASKAGEVEKVAFLEAGKYEEIVEAIKDDKAERYGPLAQEYSVLDVAHKKLVGESASLKTTLDKLQEEYDALESKSLQLEAYKTQFEKLLAQVKAGRALGPLSIHSGPSSVAGMASLGLTSAAAPVNSSREILDF